jgi:lysine/ornithine N-monooxygenase
MLLHEEGQKRKVREQLALINAVACGVGGGKAAQQYVRKLQDSIMTDEEKQARVDDDWGTLRKFFGGKVN